MNINPTLTLGAFAMCASAFAASATTVTVVTQPGTLYTSPVGVRADTGSRGVDLAGAQVIATYADTSSEVLTWGALDPYTAGEARGTDFAIYMDYEGFDFRAAKQLTRLRIDLSQSFSLADGSGRSVFDVLTSETGQPGDTPGSAFGFPVRFDNKSYSQFRFFGGLLPSGETTDAPEGAVTARYSDAVSIGAAPARGDLFSTLEIDFTGLEDGFFQGDANFETDIDTLQVAAPVPLPAGLPMLMLGLCGLAGLRLRRRR